MFQCWQSSNILISFLVGKKCFMHWSFDFGCTHWLHVFHFTVGCVYKGGGGMEGMTLIALPSLWSALPLLLLGCSSSVTRLAGVLSCVYKVFIWDRILVVNLNFVTFLMVVQNKGHNASVISYLFRSVEEKGAWVLVLGSLGHTHRSSCNGFSVWL